MKPTSGSDFDVSQWQDGDIDKDKRYILKIAMYLNIYFKIPIFCMLKKLNNVVFINEKQANGLK